MTEAAPAGTESTFQLRAPDGTALHVREARPPGAPRAELALIHGFAEHGGRYDHVLAWLTARGFACSVLDLRGHGRSGGRRTYVRRFADYVGDATTFLSHAARRPGPLFAFGHSMGALALARTLQTHGPTGLPQLAGVILGSPYLALGVTLPRWKVLLGRGLSRWVPWFRLPTDLDVAHLSRDPAVGRAYLDDPRVAQTATARWFTETLAAQEYALEAAERVRLPLLVLHGEADELAAPAAARRFVDAAGSPDKTLRLWPDLRHELLNEPEWEQVLEDVSRWLEARLPEPMREPGPRA